MTKQQDNPRRSVTLAVAFMVATIIAFAAAFYYLDGMSVVESLLGGEPPVDATASDSPAQPSSPASDATTDTVDGRLQLPAGMPEEFALRIWQEQIDSQANIAKLREGEVERLTITNTVQEGDTAVLDIEAEFTDGTSAPGELGMRRFGGVWYVAYVTGLRGESTGGAADSVARDSESGETSLPPLEDVDVELLNTILAEQEKSAAVLEEYAAGVVRAVRIQDVVEGAGTVTLKIEMDETHEEGYGEIVLLTRVLDTGRHWFIAKFTKTQEES